MDQPIANSLDDVLAQLYTNMSDKRDRWVLARANSGVEKRWDMADDMWHGRDMEDGGNSPQEVLRSGPSPRGATAQRSRVVVNIVRPKGTIVIARLCEILLPTDGNNWTMRNTPDPELQKAVGDDRPLIDAATGQPVGATLGQAAMEEAKAAKEALEGATKKLEDYLAECGYNGEQRKLIESGVRLGTGIIKGPRPTIRVTKKYKRGPNGFAAEKISDVRPASTFVDCRNVYFDPACGNDHQRGSGVFEKRPVVRRELRNLIGIPGYDPIAIKKVLSQMPKHLRVDNIDGKYNLTKVDAKDQAYTLWEYNGELEPDDIETLCGCMSEPEKAGLIDKDGALLVDERVTLVMVQDTVIGMLPPWSEDLPYDVWCWRQSDDSPFGYGICDELESQQRVITSAWRQLMDNAGLAGGPMAIMKKSAITPQDGVWQLSARKIWITNDDLDDPASAITLVQFPSVLGELLKIMESAMQLADAEANVPLLMQGDQGSASETKGGMELLYKQANSPLRHKVKLYDDKVTIPHLTRYYSFMMETDEDESIKGDYQVVARGASSLVDQDVQTVGLQALVALLGNPVFAPLLVDKAPQALRAILKDYKLDPDQFVATETELAAKQAEPQAPPPPSPEEIKAQTQIKLKEMEVQDAQADREFQMQKSSAELEHKQNALAYNAQREQSEYTIATTQSALQRDLALAKMASDENKTASELQAKERLELLKIDNQRQIFNAEQTRGTNIAANV